MNDATRSRTLPVSGDGLHVPREWLGEATEVEIRVLDSGEVRILPLGPDPLDGLAAAPVQTGLGDAVEHRDRYIDGA
jgi:hypothetical protein